MIVEALLILVVIGLLIYWVISQILSNEGNVSIVWSQHIPWSVQRTGETQLVFSTVIPVKNDTLIDITLVDVFARLQLPEEQYKDGLWQVWCRNAESARTDGYWEAFIVKKQSEMAIEIFLIMDSLKTVDLAMVNLPDFSIDLYWQIVCRNPQRVKWQRLAISADKLRETWQRVEGRV